MYTHPTCPPLRVSPGPAASCRGVGVCAAIAGRVPRRRLCQRRRRPVAAASAAVAKRIGGRRMRRGRIRRHEVGPRVAVPRLVLVSEHVVDVPVLEGAPSTEGGGWERDNQQARRTVSQR